jgi:hypothetical protein
MVRPVVAPGIFGSLLSALDGTTVEVRGQNITGLSAFCDEFRFRSAIPLCR